MIPTANGISPDGRICTSCRSSPPGYKTAVDHVASPRGSTDAVQSPVVRRSRLFGQLPGKNKLKAWSRLLISPFPRNQNHPVLLWRAVTLVGQPPTVGKVGETHCVFPGLSMGTALARSG